MISYDLIGKELTFFTLAPAVLGAKVTGRLDSILSATQANKLDDIVAQHARVYPYLTNTADDAYSYNYLLMTVEGVEKIYGIPWVVQEDLEVVDHLHVYVDIRGASQSTVEVVRQALAANITEDFIVTTGSKPLKV